jgi:hypothetical protein
VCFCIQKPPVRRAQADSPGKGTGGSAGQRLGAVSGVYRNRKPNTHDKFNLIAAGIWNYFIA